MKGKIAFLLGAAVGYVLGTRAGRERYEQIKRGAQRIWNTEPVQRGVHVVRDAVDERADEVKQVARKLGSQLLGKLSEQAAGKPPAPEGGAAAGAAEADADDSAAAKATPKSGAKTDAKGKAEGGAGAAKKRAARKPAAEGGE